MTYRPRLILPDDLTVEGEECATPDEAQREVRRLHEAWPWARHGEVEGAATWRVELPRSDWTAELCAESLLPPPRPNPRALRGSRRQPWTPTPGLPG